MEEALELAEYMPLSFKTRTEQEYVAFLWDAFETNYTHEKYQFAFLAYHMLTMSFVYFIVWQIRHSSPDDFAKGTIGFKNDLEKDLISATSPFIFSVVNESEILRFLTLIQCDNSKIGSYANLVKDRNKTAHANGNIFYVDQASVDKKIREVLRVVEEIQVHSRNVTLRCYENFLATSYDEDVREYSDATDQIREVLVHGHYFSQKDIELCLAYDPSPLMRQSKFDADAMVAIKKLHDQFLTEYKPEDD